MKPNIFTQEQLKVVADDMDVEVTSYVYSDGVGGDWIIWGNGPPVNFVDPDAPALTVEQTTEHESVMTAHAEAFGFGEPTGTKVLPPHFKFVPNHVVENPEAIENPILALLFNTPINLIAMKVN